MVARRRPSLLDYLGPKRRPQVSNRGGTSPPISLLDLDVPPEAPLVTTLNTEDKPGFWARLAAKIAALLFLVKGQK